MQVEEDEFQGSKSVINTFKHVITIYIMQKENFQ